MVQLKYFGDSRDFFKYDLIKTVLERTRLREYIFIPMLTSHRDDNEGKKIPRNDGCKSESLFKFILSCNSKSLKHWETWLKIHIDSYNTLEPVDQIFFLDETREAYWKIFESMLSHENAL